MAAVAYFLSAISIVLSCVITFFLLRRLKFVRYHSDPRNKRCFEVLPETNHGSNGNSSGNGVGKFDARKKSSSSTSLPDVEIQVPDKLGINSTAVNLAELNTEVMMPESTFPVAADEKLETDALIQITDPVVVITGSSVDTTEPDSVVILRNCFGICCFTWPNGMHRCRAYWSRYVTCFQECWPHCLSVWSVFFCSLSAFPAIQSMIQPVNPNYFIAPRWFVDVTCFLFFNLFAMLGCIVCNWIQFPSPRFLWIPVWTRTAFFIPFFLFCNFNLPDPKLPVMVGNDHMYLFAAIVFAFTNGYFSSLAMMYAPKSCAPERAEMAGMLAAFFLILGVCSGVYTSRGLVSLIL
ncbi:Equilibrative nucleoside transporter 1 [Fasciolopsis buskii]|uniref:Equilibrative nucleoside transporter 1 n=1 Tax=Fasciolopsis buskii TaxID=27845 RepID=A0A8E0RR97_9TREM|nr:Equilibrative nucleoside transporter 1 [Fasciolopsis buski]